MRHYETTFIIDPVLPGDELKQTANMYFDFLKGEGCEIVHVEETGVRQLAFPMKKRTSGAYFTVEFTFNGTGNLIDRLELAFRRDERVLRFLTISLDKYAVKYNDDKRKGLVGKKHREEQEAIAAKAKVAADLDDEEEDDL